MVERCIRALEDEGGESRVYITAGELSQLTDMWRRR